MRARQLALLVGCLLAAQTASAQAPGMPGQPPGAPGMFAPPAGPGDAPMPPGGPGMPVGPMEGAPYGDPAMADAPPIPKSWLNSFWNPQPIVEIRAEAVFLKPNFEPTPQLARQAQIDSTGSVYTSRTIGARPDEQFIAAPRLSIDWHINPFKTIEATGFILDGPDQVNSPIGQNDTPVFLSATQQDVRAQGLMTNLPPGFPTAADQWLVNWNLQSQGAELNYLNHFYPTEGPSSDLAYGLGLRYFGMNERAQLQFVDLVNGQTGRLTANADNELAGPQFIGRARLQSPLRWFRATAEGKVGLMANTSQTRMNIFTSPVGYNLGTRYTSTFFSPLVEGNFYFEFFVARNVTVFTGMQLLYVDRVSRSGGQFEMDFDRYLYDPKRLGSAFYWGPRVGLVISF